MIDLVDQDFAIDPLTGFSTGEQSCAFITIPIMVDGSTDLGLTVTVSASLEPLPLNRKRFDDIHAAIREVARRLTISWPGPRISPALPPLRLPRLHLPVQQYLRCYRAEMSGGVDEVENMIRREFGDPTINRRRDAESLSTVLSFRAEGRTFVLVVSDEFDQDYPSGTTASLDELGSQLGASANGRLTVTTAGIIQR